MHPVDCYCIYRAGVAVAYNFAARSVIAARIRAAKACWPGSPDWNHRFESRPADSFCVLPFPEPGSSCYIQISYSGFRRRELRNDAKDRFAELIRRIVLSGLNFEQQRDLLSVVLQLAVEGHTENKFSPGYYYVRCSLCSCLKLQIVTRDYS